MMPYIIILKVRKFHQTIANRFSTARQKPAGGTLCPPPQSLNRVNKFQYHFTEPKVTMRYFLCFYQQFLTYFYEPRAHFNLTTLLEASRGGMYDIFVQRCVTLSILQWTILDIFRRIRTLFRFLLTKLGYF